VHRMRDARQPGNVKPERHQIALCRDNLLLPDPRQPAPAVLQELNSWPQNFAWEPCLGFPQVRCRFRARFRPADFLSRNFRFLPPSFRLSLLRSIPPASWL